MNEQISCIDHILEESIRHKTLRFEQRMLLAMQHNEER
jgi:hypothetical protein